MSAVKMKALFSFKKAIREYGSYAKFKATVDIVAEAAQKEAEESRIAERVANAVAKAKAEPRGGLLGLLVWS